MTQLHVFPYSERPGTAALKIPYIVTEQEKHRRAHQLIGLSDRKLHDFMTRHIGTEAEVLFEKAPAGKALHGFTRNYIRVELPPTENTPELDNELRRVRLGSFNAAEDALMAELI